MRRDELSGGFAVGEDTPTAKGCGLPWIERAPAGAYFQTEGGEPWTPIGQNDSISWSDFNGLFRRRDVAAVEGHLRWLKAHGVTCLRLMLEYAQVRNRVLRHLERPAGTFAPAMVQLWDDLFALCETHGIRILLTPYDTFWMWLHWRHHPYNVTNGGFLDHPSRMLLDPAMRTAIKARFSFAIARWGGSGALFAWDLWNEIHPAQAEESADNFGEFIADISAHVRQEERRLYGRTHLQTVSLFGPELVRRAHMPLEAPIFQHQSLDFATTHLYEEGTIDYPRDTVAPAEAVGRLVRDALGRIRDGRPFLDSEHGPIHSFKDKHITLPEPFDDEYFRHMQWAHLASGGAGGGMRWPNRTPHTLTHGMRRAQRAMADFLPMLEWPSFRRRNLNEEVRVGGCDATVFACGDERQALVWLLRRDTIRKDGTLDPEAATVRAQVTIPGLTAGRFSVVGWDTSEGREVARAEIRHPGSDLTIETPAFARDVAMAVRG